MYVALSYFLGAEIAKHIGSVGTKAVIGVIVIVVIGLVIRASDSEVARNPASTTRRRQNSRRSRQRRADP